MAAVVINRKSESEHRHWRQSSPAPNVLGRLTADQQYSGGGNDRQLENRRHDIKDSVGSAVDVAREAARVGP